MLSFVVYVSVFSLLLNIRYTECSCRIAPTKVQFNKDNGHWLLFCENGKHRWSHGYHKFHNVCEECWCSYFRMICCEYGSAALATASYPGCTLIKRGCEARYMKIVDGKKLDCFSDMPFDEQFALGK